MTPIQKIKITKYQTEYIKVTTENDLLRIEASPDVMTLDEVKEFVTVLQAAIAEMDTTSALPDADGWIAWAGGECPVGPRANVEVNYANGESASAYADEFKWQVDAKFRILSYRVLP